ncbi:unnamed protein product [Brachionus calyciflorus]|uniref:Uncharacterized protein n=1 Tax=Brachionus calyciflorus TaxID=104777 RepID=A0A814BJD1_9BILA|nr:unnamed protein product [Brachionus calyciflorus]
MDKIILPFLILTFIKSAYVEGNCGDDCFSSYPLGFGIFFFAFLLFCFIRRFRKRHQRVIIVRRNMPVSMPYTVSTIDSMPEPPPDYNTVVQSNIQPSLGYSNPNFRY